MMITPGWVQLRETTTTTTTKQQKSKMHQVNYDSYTRVSLTLENYNKTTAKTTTVEQRTPSQLWQLYLGEFSWAKLQQQQQQQ